MPRFSASAIFVVIAALSAANAQLLIEPFTGTPEDFFNIIFGLVNGISVTSVELGGDPAAFGAFSMGTDPIGLESGVILSTGTATDGNGPNVDGGTTTEFGTGGDPDLSTITNAFLSDAATFTVEFDATESVIFSVRYVFASEEYNEFIDFEDPFAFFVDGVNIALAANGDAIAVNSLNCGFDGVTLSGPNCAQFINNEGGQLLVEYDGFTVVLTATSPVLAPGPHTVKFAVADGADESFDTAVFIEGDAIIVPPDDLFATVKSDPHIHGFRGQKFDFQGQPGNAYAFLSTSGLQMNVLLEDAYTPGFSVDSETTAGASSGKASGDYTFLPFQKKGTWVSQAGFLFQDGEGAKVHSLVIRAEPGETSRRELVKFGSVIVDDSMEITKLGDYQITQGISVSVTNSKSFTRIVVTSQEQSFKAIVDVVSPPGDQVQMSNDIGFDSAKLWHINIQIQSFGSQNNAHGVIGQTGNSLQNGIQGGEDDYIVKDGLLGHDFAYDKFLSPSTPRRGLKQAPSTTKHTADIVSITQSESDALRNLDASLNNLGQMPSEIFNAIFHCETMASQAVVNAHTLSEAVGRIKAGQSTPLEEGKSMVSAIAALEQNMKGDIDTFAEESLKNRNCMLRVNAVLNLNKNE